MCIKLSTFKTLFENKKAKNQVLSFSLWNVDIFCFILIFFNRYTPKIKKDEDLELYGKLDILSRTLICKLHIDKNKHITATTSHSKFPLILDNGLITVYADQHQPRLGPRVWFTIMPESTKFKLEGFANFMGLGTKTKIDVSESGTEFSLTGNLFDVTKTVVSFMSPDSLPENGPYFVSP